MGLQKTRLISLPICLYTLAVSPSLRGSRQHKRNNKNNGGFTPIFQQWRGIYQQGEFLVTDNILEASHQHGELPADICCQRQECRPGLNNVFWYCTKMEEEVCQLLKNGKILREIPWWHSSQKFDQFPWLSLVEDLPTQASTVRSAIFSENYLDSSQTWWLEGSRTQLNFCLFSCMSWFQDQRYSFCFSTNKAYRSRYHSCWGQSGAIKVLLRQEDITLLRSLQIRAEGGKKRVSPWSHEW